MTKYWVSGEEFEDENEAWEEAQDFFWNAGGFEDFWEKETDPLQIFKELERLNSPLYYELLDAIGDYITETIEQEEVEEENT